MVFLELCCIVWGFSRVMTGNSGSLSCGPGKSSLHSSCEEESGIALESRQGNRASRCIEGGISRSFSSCSRKPRFPSICDGDLRELLMVPMGSQVYCGVGRGLSGLHWGRCSRRGPHFRLRQQPQGSSPVLMWVSGCVCHFKQGVRS